MPCTDPDVRAFIPIQTEIQQKQSAKATDKPIAAYGSATGLVVDAEAD